MNAGYTIGPAAERLRAEKEAYVNSIRLEDDPMNEWPYKDGDGSGYIACARPQTSPSSKIKLYLTIPGTVNANIYIESESTTMASFLLDIRPTGKKHHKERDRSRKGFERRVIRAPSVWCDNHTLLEAKDVFLFDAGVESLREHSFL
ncbi:hypothetical protein PROFUN_12853 [Planoprotostelium fungivorum]|uniref:Uncharacterized protein n=1 Tax=Planoprotostelium fungivorum TaxID=1890364 RepID=A0A2P6N6A5_9EUKA|nr:hypothetical protein PROFUN_12853 [Planoprotostelium fungivorum]